MCSALLGHACRTETLIIAVILGSSTGIMMRIAGAIVVGESFVGLLVQLIHCAATSRST